MCRPSVCTRGHIRRYCRIRTLGNDPRRLLYEHYMQCVAMACALASQAQGSGALSRLGYTQLRVQGVSHSLASGGDDATLRSSCFVPRARAGGAATPGLARRSARTLSTQLCCVPPHRMHAGAAPQRMARSTVEHAHRRSERSSSRALGTCHGEGGRQRRQRTALVDYAHVFVARWLARCPRTLRALSAAADVQKRGVDVASVEGAAGCSLGNRRPRSRIPLRDR